MGTPDLVTQDGNFYDFKISKTRFRFITCQNYEYLLKIRKLIKRLRKK